MRVRGGCLILRGLGGKRRKRTRIRGTLCTRDGLCFENYTVFRLGIISNGSIRVADKNKSVRIFNVGFGGGVRKGVGMEKKKEEAS